MRRAARIDLNQPDIVKVLRQIGCSVHITSHVGCGFPDLVVGRNNRTMLMEVKNGLLVPKERQMRETQLFFVNEWRGHYAVARDEQDAIDIVTEATCW